MERDGAEASWVWGKLETDLFVRRVVALLRRTRGHELCR